MEHNQRIGISNKQARIIEGEELYYVSDAVILVNAEEAEALARDLTVLAKILKKKDAFEHAKARDHENIGIGDTVLIKVIEYHKWLETWSNDKLASGVWEPHRVTAITLQNEVYGASLLRDGAINGFSYIPLSFLTRTLR